MAIRMTLTRRIVDYGRRESLGSRLRARRAAPLLAMIEAVHEANGSVNIVDIGGTERYWNILPKQFLEKHRVRVTIVNLPGTRMPDDHGPFTFVKANACDLSIFADNSFHIAHSNSVLEHVGDWGRMVAFAAEVSRVAEKYFVQTPNYWFPIEPHCMTPFFHWLPKPCRVWLVSRFNLGNWRKAASVGQAVQTVESARLLHRKAFQELFKDGRIVTERVLLLPKSFVAVRGQRGEHVSRSA